MKAATIHARVPDEALQEIEFLKADLGLKNTTDVVLFALHQVASERMQNRPQKSPIELMEDLGLVGCIKDAPANLSQDYKAVFLEGIRKKHG